jgi:putative endonuclease
MSEKRERGQLGETLTAWYLEERGYRILERNYHSRWGEIDVIACKGDLLAVVEVKLRKSVSYGYPREAVTPQKQEKLRQTALYYLSQQEEEWQPRFDVAEVYALPGQTPYIEYYENAFE